MEESALDWIQIICYREIARERQSCTFLKPKERPLQDNFVPRLAGKRNTHKERGLHMHDLEAVVGVLELRNETCILVNHSTRLRSFLPPQHNTGVC
jgi:hypothetical protein